jgi:hypothetical protein
MSSPAQLLAFMTIMAFSAVMALMAFIALIRTTGCAR